MPSRSFFRYSGDRCTSGGATSRGFLESSHKALRIMQITTVMLVILLIWSPHHAVVSSPPAFHLLPTPSNLHLTKGVTGLAQRHDIRTNLPLS